MSYNTVPPRAERYGSVHIASTTRINKSSIYLRRAKSILLSLSNVKRIGVELQTTVAQLSDPHALKLFGTVNIGDLLYKSYTSLAIFNDEEQLCGVVAFDHYPNVLAIPAWSWTKWLNDLYGLKDMTTDNTNWIHYMASEKKYLFSYAKIILQSLFLRYRKIKYVLLLVPPGVTAIDYLDDIGILILPLTQDYFSSKKVQKIYLFMRQNFILNYKMRRAVEEDNDDLVPLIHDHSNLFERFYGEYYIAELLTSHEDCGRQLVVSEFGGKACGVVILNELLNYEILRNEFEVAPYDGLKSLTSPQRIIKEEHEEEEVILQHEYNEHDIDYSKTLSLSVSLTSSEESRSNTTYEVQEEESEDDFSIVNLSSTALLAFIKSSESFIDDIESSDESLYQQFNEFSGIFTKNFKKYSSQVEELKHDTDIQTYLSLIPTYVGTENAFALEVCCTSIEHENAIGLLLESAFECFPEREYLVLASVPTHQSHIITKHLVRVPHRPMATFPHELYILHRSAMAGAVSVHCCTTDDMRNIFIFLDKQSKREELYNYILDALKNKDSRLYVYSMNCEGTIVGLAIIDEEADADFFAKNFEFSPYVNIKFHKSGSYGKLIAIVLTPVFQTHGPFFIRELHMLSDFSLLFYILSDKDPPDKNKGMLPVCNLLQYLIPLKPRQLPSYDKSFLKEFMPSEKVLQPIDLFSLYISTPRMASIERIEINTKIVVVGASTAGISFMETLILTQTTNYVAIFTNVTVISPFGIPCSKPMKPPRNMFFVERNGYNYQYMEQYPLRSYINTIQGTVNAIERKHKFVTVDGKYVVPYDYLFLMCGQQFQSPVKKVTYNGEVKTVRSKPDNVIIINNMHDAAQAMLKIKAIQNMTEKDSILIYGHYLEAYGCVAALLEMEVPGHNLIFLDPYPKTVNAEGLNEEEKISVFNDGEIEDSIMDIIRGEGVTVYESYEFRTCVVNEKNVVKKVVFESKHRLLSLDCSAIIFYCHKNISHRTFMAMTMSGLVFDGQLVINKECRTNDEFIYGCGSLTRYSQRYYDLNGMHKYFDQKEVGRNLALRIRKKLLPPQYMNEEPQVEQDLIPHARSKLLLPKFVQPKVEYCQLPGKLYYLSVRKPGPPVPVEAAMTKDTYGIALVTGNPKKMSHQGYFRLHINDNKTVETITCLSLEPIDVNNLKSLYGKHEVLLNKLLTRFEMFMIPDLYDYFKEPWAYGIYHDHFPSLMSQTMNILLTTQIEPDRTLFDNFVELYEKNNWNKLTPEQEAELYEQFNDSDLRNKYEQAVMQYLQTDSDQLPMYASPMFIRQLLAEYQSSPMFC